jgi:hypothetical protein
MRKLQASSRVCHRGAAWVPKPQLSYVLSNRACAAERATQSTPWHFGSSRPPHSNACEMCPARAAVCAIALA